MPRTRRTVTSIEDYEKQIAATEKSIEKANVELKNLKKELRKLRSLKKAEEERLAAEKKAEDEARILKAFEDGNKSADEIINLIQG